MDEFVRYRHVLRKHIHADCNRDYDTFEEAVYPVDLEHLAELTADELPEDLNELVRVEVRAGGSFSTVWALDSGAELGLSGLACRELVGTATGQSAGRWAAALGYCGADPLQCTNKTAIYFHCGGLDLMPSTHQEP